MMELTSDFFDIRCAECGERITIYKDDLDIEESFYDHGENGMGEEIIYDIRHELECPECSNDILITITGSEYPVGAYDYDSADISGARFIDIPSMGIVYYREEFDIDVDAVRITGIQALIVRISRDRDLIYDVTSREFEEIVEQLLKDEGFETLLTNSTRDGGRDIIATKAGINGRPVVFYVECKRYARHNKVNVGIVRSLYGVQTSDKINKACIVTSSLFTKDAFEFAQKQNVMIDLVDGDALQEMIQRSAEKYNQNL